MPVAFLYTTPTSPSELRRFFFYNASDHNEINLAILKQKSVNIFGRVLDPVDTSETAFQSWVEQHQQAHNDINSALKLNGQDLTDIELKNPNKLRDWIFVHASEHLAMRQALAI